MRQLDVRIFYDVNGWPEALRPFFVFLSEGIRDWPLRLAFTILVLAMIWRGGRARPAVILALLSWPLANFITDQLKNSLRVPRPNVELAHVALRTDYLTSFGTASAHSANMAAVATVFCWRLGYWGLPWVLLAFLTGLSRIYVGVHYPSQVLFGWLCGVFAASLILTIEDLFQRRRQSPPTHDAPSETAHLP
ncbi:MAG: phosphatase PAP2 family protein [Armatimonadetes bacterium]|nr:phosphatase PAP2 family protein [Armatimonadota bacterium]